MVVVVVVVVVVGFEVEVLVRQTCEKKLQKSIQLAFNGRFYVSTEGSPIFQASLSNSSTAIQFRSKESLETCRRHEV